jgi:death-on-curing protein
LAQPQAAFAGDFVHDGLFAMAAAYLFYIVSNHPFLDGNKRTGRCFFVPTSCGQPCG